MYGYSSRKTVVMLETCANPFTPQAHNLDMFRCNREPYEQSSLVASFKLFYFSPTQGQTP